MESHRSLKVIQHSIMYYLNDCFRIMLQGSVPSLFKVNEQGIFKQRIISYRYRIGYKPCKKHVNHYDYESVCYLLFARIVGIRTRKFAVGEQDL